MDIDDFSYSGAKNEFSFKAPKEEETAGEKKTDAVKESAQIDSFDDNTLSFLPKKTLSLIIGIFVIALFIPFLIFSLAKSKSKPTSPSTKNQVTQNASLSPSPSPKPATVANKQTGLPLTGSPAQPIGTKTYKDPFFGYSVSIPGNWEAFKNAGGGTAYQMAFRPIGSPDVPFTVGAQGGTSETEWINTVYGANYPRETNSVAGKPATLIKTPRYISYYTHDNTYTYEISEALGNQQYTPVYNSILSSLTFSK